MTGILRTANTGVSLISHNGREKGMRRMEIAFLNPFIFIPSDYAVFFSFINHLTIIVNQKGNKYSYRVLHGGVLTFVVSALHPYPSMPIIIMNELVFHSHTAQLKLYVLELISRLTSMRV